MADIVVTGGQALTAIGAQFMPTKADIQIYKGDYLEFFVQFKDEVSATLDLNGYTPKMQLRTSTSATDGILIDTAIVQGNTKVRVTISSAVSAAFTSNSYVYDLQLTDASSRVRTYLTGTLSVTQEVTK